MVDTIATASLDGGSPYYESPCNSRHLERRSTAMDPLLNPTTRPPDRRTLGLRARTTRQSDRQNCRQRTNSAACAIPESASDLSAPEGIRTPNLLIRSQMLYPLSYGRLLFSCRPAEARGFEPPVPL